jgi:arsenate reductase
MQILFLCTANSCRSILAEAVFNHLAPANMRAYSAGSRPKGLVHPQSLHALQRAGISIEGLHSKSHGVHQQLNPDLVITLCDSAAAEPCPPFFGNAVKAHWGLPDPDGLGASPAEVDSVFDKTVTAIQQRVAAFLELTERPLDHQTFSREVQAIGDRQAQTTAC